jgi:hypothetical protein
MRLIQQRQQAAQLLDHGNELIARLPPTSIVKLIRSTGIDLPQLDPSAAAGVASRGA